MVVKGHNANFFAWDIGWFALFFEILKLALRQTCLLNVLKQAFFFFLNLCSLFFNFAQQMILVWTHLNIRVEIFFFSHFTHISGNNITDQRLILLEALLDLFKQLFRINIVSLSILLFHFMFEFFSLLYLSFFFKIEFLAPNIQAWNAILIVDGNIFHIFLSLSQNLVLLILFLKFEEKGFNFLLRTDGG